MGSAVDALVSGKSYAPSSVSTTGGGSAVDRLFSTPRPSVPSAPRQPQPQAAPRESIGSKLSKFGRGAVSSIINPIAKLTNDVGALGLEQGALAQTLTGHRPTLDKKAQQVTAPGGGVAHQGGILGGNEYSKDSVFIGKNAKQNIEKTAGTGASIASDLVASGAGKAVKSGSLLAKTIKAAGVGSAATATGSIGSQLADTGKVNLKQTAEAALAGLLLSAGGHVIGTAAAKAGQKTTDSLINKTPLTNAKTNTLLAKVRASEQKPSISKTTTNIDALVKDTAKPTIKGEEGFANPAAAVSDVKSMIDKHQESTKFTGDLERAASSVEGSKNVISQDAAKLIKERPTISNTDKKTLQDYRDARAAGLTPKPLPEHLQAEDAAVTELNKATQAHDAELARLNGQEAKAQQIEARNPETYTHRVAQDKGNAFDYLLQGDRKSPISVGMGKTTPASKARTMMAVTDEQGNRRVVAIKNTVLKDAQGNKVAQGKLVQAIDNGGSENLGKLNLKTNQDFLDKELQPFQTKIKNLQKEGDTLSAVKAKGGVSDARMKSLAQKAALLEDARNFSTLTKPEAKSLRDATIKLRELTKVKEPGTNASGRLETINRHLIDLNNKINEIHAKYDTENLDKKIFVGKDGKKYTIGQATTSEITRATGQKYYVDPKLTSLANYVESRTALENARFIESIKNHPDFEKFGVGPGETAPKGWRSVPGFMQFQGWRFDPKTAQTMTDIAKSGGNEQDILDHMGRFLKQTIVYFPVKHDLNMATAYTVDRGLISLASPIAYKRMFSSLYQGLHETINQGPLFQELQKKGFSLPSADNKKFEEAFNEQLKALMDDKPAINKMAKEIGTSPMRLLKAYSATQHVSVWMVQDALNIARVIERMQPKMFGMIKGKSLGDAMKETEKFSFQYKVPTRVMGSRGTANLLKSNKVFFGRYLYDKWKIFSNILKGSMNITKPQEAAASVDKLAVLALGAMVMWPLVDKGIQRLSGDPNAKMTAPGPLEIASKIQEVATGKTGWRQAVSNQLYLNGAFTMALDIKNNRDSFTGKNIADPNAPSKEQAKQTATWVMDQLSPTQKIKSLDNTKSKAASIGLSLAGTSFPKNSPEANKLSSLAFDSLPGIQQKAKQQVQSGNISAAKQTADQYNQEVMTAAKAALKQAGKSVPDDETLKKQLIAQRVYFNLSDTTIQNWQKPPTSLIDRISTPIAPKTKSLAGSLKTNSSSNKPKKLSGSL